MAKRDEMWYNVLFSPTNGNDHVKTSMKLGSQYGCGVQSEMISLSTQVQFRQLTELPDVHNVVLVLQDSRLIIVHVEVVRCAEDGHHARKTCRPSLPVHAVSSILSLVCTNDGKQIVLF